MRLSKDKRSLVVAPSLTLVGIPAEAFNYRLGNRSAIRLDPNRPDDPEYITRLLAQVIRLSLDTLSTIRSLPAWRV